jgi:hypothetical protein
VAYGWPLAATANSATALIALLSSAALLLGAPGLAGQGAATTAPLQWAVAPSLLPPGAMIAVVSGDPTGPGQSTIELSMPDGYRMPPHLHPTEERVEVKQGTLLIGKGDRLDARKTLALAVGDTAYEAPQPRVFPNGY